MIGYHFLNYSNDKFKDARVNTATKLVDSKLFASVTSLNRSDLENTYFYKNHKHILDREKGAGFCLWKPFFILETLKQIPDNDILIYLDAADEIKPEGLINYLQSIFMMDILVVPGVFRQGDWTKRDTFVSMNMDSKEYWNLSQLEAGIFICRNTNFTRGFVKTWLDFCRKTEAITDDPNILGFPNLDQFKEHRYDQSILTNLVHAYNDLRILTDNNVRNWITCNVL